MESDSTTMTSAMPTHRAETIAALLQREVKPVFFLGAGASLRSGIPLAGMLVAAIARFAYCKVHNRNPDDPTLMPSDWLRWLENQTWYQPHVPQANLYPMAVEHLLQPQSNRKEFFQRILRPDVPASEGYHRLAHLLARRQVRTVLTTNFDDLVTRTALETPAVRHVEEIFTESDHTLFRTNPPHPQVVYLHGSVKHYTDRNLIRETQTLDPNLADLLQPLLRDHPLVVIGYRGTEPSIMKDLLINRADRCGRYREGIYWCHLTGSSPTESPLVSELRATIGNNFQFVEIEGFDELLIAADRSVQASSTNMWSLGAPTAEPTASSQVHDLQASSLRLPELNESLLRTKLVEYAGAMRMSPPELRTSEQLWAAMLAQNLAIAVGTDRRATKGGQLLFAKSEAQQIDAAKISVTVSGLRSWVNEVLDQPMVREPANETVSEALTLTGDLWSQLDQASNLLSRVNRPFRMKGPVSQSAYPYPPLALKELLTNLLAHRDYQGGRCAMMTITREEIRFENPGGLVDSVRGQLEDESIQQVIGGGTRRLKGYRNPVVADFFFAAGAMDKEGSGLPDVVQEAANNLNTVFFGPTTDNASFQAVIRCRPESLHVDQETKTARPQQGELRYSPNLLRIMEWPERVRKLGTVASAKELARVEMSSPAPPFGAYRNWIWTFSDLASSNAHGLLNLVIEEEQHEVDTAELLSDRDAGAILPRLLNAALAAHLKQLGMLVRFEQNRLRAYYPSNDGNPKEISYKSAFRQSKRTVAKPIVSRTSGKVVYWEHKAVSLRFERFASTWALSLLPGYVFTMDGYSQPIASERIGPLSTRRAARDYNPTVLHDLVFWSRMLSAQSEPDFSVSVSDGPQRKVIRLASLIPTFVFQEAIESGIADAREAETLTESDLDLQEEIEQVIAESAETEEEDEAADR